jgi:hypothetical protein
MTLFDLIEPQRNLLTSDVNICGTGEIFVLPKSRARVALDGVVHGL